VTGKDPGATLVSEQRIVMNAVVPEALQRHGAVAANDDPRPAVETAVPAYPRAGAAPGERRPGLLRVIAGSKGVLLLLALLSLSLGTLLWHVLTLHKVVWLINFENVPSPEQVWSSLWQHLATGQFYIHVVVSMRRILIGFGLAILFGVGLGALVGRSRYARAVVMPYVEIIRPIPAVAWIPMAILMWPTEESSIVYITFLGALFPILLNTVHGVEQAPEVLIRAARSLGASPLQILWHVILPSALPSISAGLAIGIGVSWFSLLAGEIISGQYGIGYFTWNAYSLVNYPDIVVGMLAIGGLGTLSTYLVRLATRPALRWQVKR
jgi:NitT/TauT family transport system permease protein